jgi:hypothetical protein
MLLNGCLNVMLKGLETSAVGQCAAGFGVAAVTAVCLPGHVAFTLLQVSTVLGAALEEQRKEGEWIEGIAIWVAVAIVIMVGKCHLVL